MVRCPTCEHTQISVIEVLEGRSKLNIKEGRMILDREVKYQEDLRIVHKTEEGHPRLSCHFCGSIWTEESLICTGETV